MKIFIQGENKIIQLFQQLTLLQHKNRIRHRHD